MLMYGTMNAKYRNLDLNFWAKTSQKERPGVHPVICHLLDVGNSCREVLTRYVNKKLMRYLMNAIDLRVNGRKATKEEFIAFLCFLSAAHDIGKISPSFQRKISGQLEDLYRKLSIYRYLDTADGFHYHAGLSVNILQRYFDKTELAEGTDGLMNILIALSAHHGIPSTYQAKKAAKSLGWYYRGKEWIETEWNEQQDLALDFLADHFGLSGNHYEIKNPTRYKQSAFVLLAGVFVIADWIGSSEHFKSIADDQGNRPVGFSISQYAKDVIQMAKNAADAIDIDNNADLIIKDKDEIDLSEFIPGGTPYKSQVEIIEASKKMVGSYLAIIEDQTGGGKSEATFKLQHDAIIHNGHSGGYWGMPTCGLATAMLDRYQRDIESKYPDAKRHLHLIHSQSMFDDDYKNLKGNFEDYDDDGEKRRRVKDDSKAYAKQWYASGRRRMLATFGIGTIDQALLCVIQSKFNFLRLLGLSNKVIVFDEIHAYDFFSTTLIEHCIQWLSASGCTVILLSATLPSHKRAKLCAAFRGSGDIDGIETCDYPRATFVNKWKSDGIVTQPLTSSYRRTYRITASNEADTIDYIVKNVQKHGGCVGFICNRVRQANGIYAEFKRALANHPKVELYLHHARFDGPIRAKKEQLLLKKFGKEGIRNLDSNDKDAIKRPKAAIVVGTQLLEQSLDIDFDFMATTLSPIDLVVQRIGRDWRFDIIDSLAKMIKRPEWCHSNGRPRIRIVVNKVGRYQVPDFGDDIWVYRSLYLFKTYLKLVAPASVDLMIPDDVQKLVDFVYPESDDFKGLRLSKRQRMQIEEWDEKLNKLARKQRLMALAEAIPSPYSKDGIFNEQACVMNTDIIEEDYDEDDNDASAEDGSKFPGFEFGLADTVLTRLAPPNEPLVFMQREGNGFRLLGEDSVISLDNISFTRATKFFEHRVPVMHRRIVDYVREVRECSRPWDVYGMTREEYEQWGEYIFLRRCVPIICDQNWEAILNGTLLRDTEEYGVEVQST